MKARRFANERRKWWTLVAVSSGLFMIMLDTTGCGASGRQRTRPSPIVGGSARKAWCAQRLVPPTELPGGNLQGLEGVPGPAPTPTRLNR